MLKIILMRAIIAVSLIDVNDCMNKTLTRLTDKKFLEISYDVGHMGVSLACAKHEVPVNIYLGHVKNYTNRKVPKSNRKFNTAIT